MDLALHAIESNANWRDEYADGRWFDGWPIGQGSFSLEVLDPEDGDISAGVCDPLIFVGYGQQNDAHQALSVLARADAENFDPLYDLMISLRPLAYWRLGDEAGVVATDETGHYSGIYRGGPGLAEPVPFRCDRCVRFDGYNDFVEIPHDNDFLLVNGTICVWFLTSDTFSAQGLFSKDSSDYDEGGHVYLRVTGGNVLARLQSDHSSYYVWSDPIAPARWHFAVLTFGSEGMHLYVDGRHEHDSWYTGGLGDTSGGDGNHEPIALGVCLSASADHSTNGWLYPVSGYLDEVAMFDRALSGGEIRDIYQTGTILPPHTMTLEAGTWRRVVD